MYCGINEAFNYSSIQKSNNLSESNFDNYSTVSINNDKTKYSDEINNGLQYMKINNDILDDNICPAFFTAQGNYSTQGPYAPKTVAQLKENKDKNINKNKDKHKNKHKNNNCDGDSFSLLDSEFSTDSLFDPSILQMKNQKKKKMSHEYYIEKIIKSLLENNKSLDDNKSLEDNKSLDKSLEDHSSDSTNLDVYAHVKSCKLCKNKINKRMKEYFKPEINLKEENKESINLELGYDLKEILIIVLAGIVLIFILDLLVKIGKRIK